MNKLAALWALVLVTLFGGCAATRQCGDARLTRTRPNLFQPGLSDGYLVKLPEVSLARTGVTEFHVTSLPAMQYVYYLRLRGGSVYNGFYTPQTASHYNARVEFRFIAPDGSPLATVTEPLGEMTWTHDPGSITANAFPQLPSPLHHARDYRLRITVRQPSRAAGERMLVYGYGY